MKPLQYIFLSGIGWCLAIWTNLALWTWWSLFSPALLIAPRQYSKATKWLHRATSIELECWPVFTETRALFVALVFPLVAPLLLYELFYWPEEWFWEMAHGNPAAPESWLEEAEASIDKSGT